MFTLKYVKKTQKSLISQNPKWTHSPETKNFLFIETYETAEFNLMPWPGLSLPYL